jgi:hypothetical protein
MACDPIIYSMKRRNAICCCRRRLWAARGSRIPEAVPSLGQHPNVARRQGSQKGLSVGRQRTDNVCRWRRCWRGRRHVGCLRAATGLVSTLGCSACRADTTVSRTPCGAVHAAICVPCCSLTGRSCAAVVLVTTEVPAVTTGILTNSLPGCGACRKPPPPVATTKPSAPRFASEERAKARLAASGGGTASPVAARALHRSSSDAQTMAGQQVSRPVEAPGQAGAGLVEQSWQQQRSQAADWGSASAHQLAAVQAQLTAGQSAEPQPGQGSNGGPVAEAAGPAASAAAAAFLDDMLKASQRTYALLMPMLHCNQLCLAVLPLTVLPMTASNADLRGFEQQPLAAAEDILGQAAAAKSQHLRGAGRRSCRSSGGDRRASSDRRGGSWWQLPCSCGRGGGM